MPHLRTAATLLLCASMASLSTGGAWARDTASDTTAAVLETLNQEYRALYREGTQQVLDSLPLVLVVQNHTITAVRGEQRKLYPVPLQRYNEARAVVHAALGFQGLMAGQIRRQESGQDAEWVRVDAFVTDNLETAATASSLGVDKLGRRIFYSENIFDVDGALAYLRTLVGDQALSEDAFGRPQRMWEDLFAPVSRELINTDFYTELK